MVDEYPEFQLRLPNGSLWCAGGCWRKSGITIHQHMLDLDQPSVGLLADVRSLAGRLLPRTSGTAQSPHSVPSGNG